MTQISKHHFLHRSSHLHQLRQKKLSIVLKVIIYVMHYILLNVLYTLSILCTVLSDERVFFLGSTRGLNTPETPKSPVRVLSVSLATRTNIGWSPGQKQTNFADLFLQVSVDQIDKSQGAHKKTNTTYLCLVWWTLHLSKNKFLWYCSVHFNIWVSLLEAESIDISPKQRTTSTTRIISPSWKE